MSTTPILKPEQDEGSETNVQPPDQSTWYVEEPIISNAVKYSENTGVIHIQWSADRDGRKRLSVQDEGFGIPADQLDYVTEPFTQGTARNDNNALIARTGTGVGLSLHIVSLLAKLHGAEVDIDFEENRGTSVLVIFPKPAFPRWLVHFVSVGRDFSIIFSRLDGLKGG
jgi:signal transduction histidine kinase